jgi:hypothetical protein
MGVTPFAMYRTHVDVQICLNFPNITMRIIFRSTCSREVGFLSSARYPSFNLHIETSE